MRRGNRRGPRPRSGLSVTTGPAARHHRASPSRSPHKRAGWPQDAEVPDRKAGAGFPAPASVPTWARFSATPCEDATRDASRLFTESLDAAFSRLDLAPARFVRAERSQFGAEAPFRRTRHELPFQKDRSCQFMLNHRYTSVERSRRSSRHGGSARHRRDHATAFGRSGLGASSADRHRSDRETPTVRSLLRRRG